VAFDGGREEEGDREEGATKEEDREGEGEEGEGDLMGRLRRVGMLVESAATMGSEPGGGSRRRHATSAEEAEERSEARVESAMSTDIVPPGPITGTDELRADELARYIGVDARAEEPLWFVRLKLEGTGPCSGNVRVICGWCHKPCTPVR